MARNWIWSEHIELRMLKRKISRDLVEMAVNEPDEVLPAEQNRLIYQKIVDNKLVRVVVEGNILVTVYITSKIKKYLRG
jgi:L-ribulose-5-phosphate 3-epimerase UlaE